jgi:hypothetical protein
MPDGVSDIIVDFLAASYVALSANEYLKKRSWKEVSRDFVRTDMKKLYGLENHAMEERARLTDLE